jgi:hypothetical protein
MTTLIPKFDLKNGGATPTGAVNRPINQKLEEYKSVKDFGAVGDNITDDTTAIQNAVNTGLPIFFPTGVYKITAPIVSNGKDFVIMGETYNAMSEKNNEENNFTGSVINYFGSNAAYPIDVVNTPNLTNQIAIQNITIAAAKTHQFGIVRLKGNSYTTEYGATVTMSDVRIVTRDYVAANGINGYVATGLVIDCGSSWFFGASFTNIYIFGVQTGILVSATAGFFNSNTFTNIKQYQVWRALHLQTNDMLSGTSIVANLFDGFYVQPNAQSGVWADGVIFLDGNVAQNVFVAPNVYDMPLGTGTEFRSETDFVGSGRNFENIFVGPMCNNIFNGRVGTGYFVGWGQNSFGQFAASNIKLLLAQPSINTTATAITLDDQNTATIRYPRNGAANDIEIYVSGTTKAATLNFQGVFLPVQAASAPTYIKGGVYFDTTLNKLRVGGATAWETITSV